MLVSSTIVCSSIFFIISNAIYKVCKTKRYRRLREECASYFQEGNGRYKHMVFISYCDNDSNFAKFVFTSLENNLRNMFRYEHFERRLVCFGEDIYTHGQPLLIQAERFFNDSAVFLAVVSNNYYKDGACRIQYDNAVEENMPIVLLLNEDIEHTNMPPHNRSLDQHGIRWTRKDSYFVLSTTWEAVCEAILRDVCSLVLPEYPNL